MTPRPSDGATSESGPEPEVWFSAVEPGVLAVSWAADVIATDVRQAVGAVLADGQAERVVARVPVADRRGVSIAGRAGLRKEGLERGVPGLGDVVRLARLAADPEPTTAEGFRGVLNAGLNRTRVIAQVLVTDEVGRVLLCELTYKTYWDLPGGVVDPHESPAAGAAREVLEELGVEITVEDLLVVSWLPPWQGWDDACLFLFRAAAPSDVVEAAMLEHREIAALHWCASEDLDEHVADYTARLVRAALEATEPLYLEDARPR